MLQFIKVKGIFFIFLLALAGVWVLGRGGVGTLVIGPASQISPPSSSASLAIEPQAPAIVGPSVTIGQTVIAVELATTTEAVQKGLSGRASLGSQSGMLFIFSKPDIYRFWMPDMHFPLDIIWVNDGTVVDISENVSNEFDPRAPRFYAPSKPVRYVLEVNAGFAADKNIQIGDPVVFSL
ncbi:MAG: DUF192 domain-containing protein [bacterium]|nr:DUF192 domain-containing protein [bacterium]